MQRYDDLVELARICARHAKAAGSEALAAELRRMADEYQRRAAAVGGGEPPKIEG